MLPASPDGRDGWATYFLRKGYAVYVVDQVARGRDVYETNCVRCHGVNAVGGVKDLRHMTRETHAAFNQIVREGLYLVAANRYRRRIITLRTELEGLVQKQETLKKEFEDKQGRAANLEPLKQQLAQMEKGKLKREAFMAEIAAMAERIVKKAKEYDRDTIPGDYATLATPCPNCGGVVKENYRRYTCTGKTGAEDGCGFSFGKSPAGRTFEQAEVEQFLRDKHIGPLDGFRSKAGWPFVAEMVIKFDEEAKNYKLEFDFGDDKAGEESGELIDFSAQETLGPCPKCGKLLRSDIIGQA